MSRPGIVAVIPMKPLRLAKSRMADRLTVKQRATLSLNMLDRVLGAALESPVQKVWVVGGDSAVRRRASRMGVEWCADNSSGLNGALTEAFLAAFASGLTPMYLPADLPFLLPEDISTAVDASSGGGELTLSPAHRDGGTNAIIVPVGSPFRPAMGTGSFQRHKDQAMRLGLQWRICDRPGLGLDLDTLDDLTAFETMEPGILDRLLAQPGPSTADG